jgi:DNA-binding NarL/FixJ family response regulator
MKNKILLVDDNMLFRKGLRALLSAQPEFTVLDDLGGNRDVLHETLRQEPDIVLMDMHAFGVNGLNMVTQIKRRMSQVRAVLLTNLRTEDYVRGALGAGVDGYVLKNASLDELVMALTSVAAGKKYLSPDVSGHVVECFLHPEVGHNGKSGMGLLTSRERGILQLIAEGRTNRSAAEFLCVSAKTVEKYRSSLMQKLGLRNACELTLVAIEMGLVERPQAISRLMGVSMNGLAATPE